jgi:hypothetical protein
MPEWDALIVVARRHGYVGADTPRDSVEVQELATALGRARRQPLPGWVTPEEVIRLAASGTIAVDMVGGPCP